MFKDDFNVRLDVLLTRIGRARKSTFFWGCGVGEEGSRFINIELVMRCHV